MVETEDMGSLDSTRPVMLVVEDIPADQYRLETVLTRRFGSDYEVVVSEDASQGIELLADWVRHGRRVATVLASAHLQEMGGAEFLEKVRAVDRSAVRVLVLPMDRRGTRIPFDDLQLLQRAISLGQADTWVLKHWTTPEEQFYPVVQEALVRWTRESEKHHEVLRVVGEQWAPASHELRDRLTRNTVPFGFYDVNSEEGQRLIDQYGVDVSRLPGVILFDGSVLHQPELTEVANALGVHTQPSSDPYDLAIIGAGPSGLAAAVYGASEGLKTVVLERQAIGGQAGTSSSIRNYLGFPQGVSGGDLAFRGWQQALLFGAEFVFMQEVTGIDCGENLQRVLLSGGSVVQARAVIIATGVQYRRLTIKAIDRLIGAGVYYGAATAEAPAMQGEDVCVVGGANSAGQAALHLARYAHRTTLLIRGGSLEAGMSEYLCRQIAATPNLEVRLNSEIVDGRGEERLEAVKIRDRITGKHLDLALSGLFVLIGAQPHTAWLPENIARDSHGFILTGTEVPTHLRSAARTPLDFETSRPGIFAVGDVRHASVKRVAGAVGEGSVAVGSVHMYLELVSQ